MPEYADYLESQLTGCYDREIPPMDDDILESDFDEDAPEPEPVHSDHTCELCGCDVARYEIRVGKTRVFNCRNCGMTSYLEVE
jgi:hypothetical protein